MKSSNEVDVQDVKIKPPSECTDEEIQSFFNLVKRGGEVDINTLEAGIRRARLLTFCYINQELAGVAALKNADQGYQNNVFERAGEPKLAEKFQSEIGYIYIEEKYRGRHVCPILVQHLMNNSADKIFSTVRMRNKNMIKIIRKLGFRQVGHRFVGKQQDKGRYYVQLFVK
jgi:RimJ/RimL family protein N-acetyltransferase